MLLKKLANTTKQNYKPLGTQDTIIFFIPWIDKINILSYF